MKIVTHNGHFHTDDLMAVAALLLKFPDALVVRSREEEQINSAEIAVDVGRTYAPEKLRFDHHQSESAGVRPNGIPYASFGLVWKYCGEELAGGAEEARLIEERLVMPIDAMDNGIRVCSPVIEDVHEYSLGDFFESFASQANTMEDYDKIFADTLVVAKELLEREIALTARTVKSWHEVREVYEKSEDKKIIVLPRHMQWKTVLIPSEAVYVVYPRPDGKWALQAIPQAIRGFESKKDLPLSWGGLADENLASVTGVEDATFCHRERFLAVAKSREGAIKLAEIALNS